MLALESARRQSHPYFPHYPMETSAMFDAAGLSFDQLHGYTQQQQQQHYDEGSSIHPSFYDFQTIYSEPPPEYLPSLSAASGPSVNSASSSAIGSPNSGITHRFPEGWFESRHGLELQSTMDPGFLSNALDVDVGFYAEKLPDSFVDPAMIQPGERQQHLLANNTLGYSEQTTSYPVPHAGYAPESAVASPLTANEGYPPETAPLSSHLTQTPPASIHDRRSSISSIHSGISQRSSAASSSSSGSGSSSSSGSTGADGDIRDKGPCPDCGRVLKDLKSHRLTHLKERPEKCPISTCAYHTKGFARKYDKNRHTLTHYKGTMVCGFCPGSGSPAEKSFNRADVFKRHLIKIHCVGDAATAAGGKQKHHHQQHHQHQQQQQQQQQQSTSAYGGGGVTGKCSTCGATFRNAQEFYDHVDECVLRVVQREEPSEAINQLRLAEVAADAEVQKTMEKHMLLDTTALPTRVGDDGNNSEDAEDDSDADADDDDVLDNERTATWTSTVSHRRNRRSGRGCLKSTKDKERSSSRVVLGTNSAITKSGRPFTSTTTTTPPAPPLTATITSSSSSSSNNNKRRNNRDRDRDTHYPASWTHPRNSIKTKKRVLCMFDGARRLWKDEMMLDNEFEVRVRLPGGAAAAAADGTNRDAYITDLDVETIRRAEGVFSANEEERGPWVVADDSDGGEEKGGLMMGRSAMYQHQLNQLNHGGGEEGMSLEELMS